MNQNQNSQNNNNQLKYHLGNSSSSNSSTKYNDELSELKTIVYDTKKLVKTKFKPLKDFINAIFPNNTMENKYTNMQNLLDTDILLHKIFLKSSYSYVSSISLANLKDIVEILEKPETKTRYIQIRNGVYKKNNNSVAELQNVQQNVNRKNNIRQEETKKNIKELYKLTDDQYSLLLDIFLNRKVLTYESDYHDLLILVKKFKYKIPSYRGTTKMVQDIIEFIKKNKNVNDQFIVELYEHVKSNKGANIQQYDTTKPIWNNKRDLMTFIDNPILNKIDESDPEKRKCRDVIKDIILNTCENIYDLDIDEFDQYLFIDVGKNYCYTWEHILQQFKDNGWSLRYKKSKAPRIEDIIEGNIEKTQIKNGESVKVYNILNSYTRIPFFRNLQANDRILKLKQLYLEALEMKRKYKVKVKKELSTDDKIDLIVQYINKYYPYNDDIGTFFSYLKKKDTEFSWKNRFTLFLYFFISNLYVNDSKNFRMILITLQNKYDEEYDTIINILYYYSIGEGIPIEGNYTPIKLSHLENLSKSKKDFTPQLKYLFNIKKEVLSVIKISIKMVNMFFVDEKYINRERTRAFKPLSINQYLDQKIEEKIKNGEFKDIHNNPYNSYNTYNEVDKERIRKEFLKNKISSDIDPDGRFYIKYVERYDEIYNYLYNNYHTTYRGDPIFEQYFLEESPENKIKYVCSEILKMIHNTHIKRKEVNLTIYQYITILYGTVGVSEYFYNSGKFLWKYTFPYKNKNAHQNSNTIINNDNVDYDLFNKDNKNINSNINVNNTIKYANFHNLTFLYNKDYHSIEDFYKIESEKKIKYFEKIREYISRNKNKIKDGDIIFIGSTYETRQEYGFAIVELNDFINENFPNIKKYLENGKKIYYKKAIDKVNNFWRKYEGQDYFNEDDIEQAKENEYYEPNNNKRNNLKSNNNNMIN